MRLGPGLLYEGRTLQGARPKLADFCSATMAEFYSAVDKLYLEGWLQRGWRKSNGKKVANCELWRRIHSLAAERHVTFYNISANSNDPDKIRVDALAKEAAEKAAKRAYHAPKGRG